MQEYEQLGMNIYRALRKEFVPPENRLDLKITNVEVRRIRKLNIINDFLNMHRHYIHSGDNYKSIGVFARAYGLYIGSELCGIATYNAPGSSTVAEWLFGRSGEAQEHRQGTLALTRLLTLDGIPFNATGYLEAHARRLIWEDNKDRDKENKPRYKTVVTFADWRLKHSGTVYRAGSAWYAGISKGGSLSGFYNPVTGDVISTRQGRRTLTMKDCPEGWEPLISSDKFRYIYFTGGSMVQLNTMQHLSEEVKLHSREGEYYVCKEGRFLTPSDSRCYDEVYQVIGGRQVDKPINKRYIDYLS